MERTTPIFVKPGVPQISVEEFWEKMTELNWHDKSEGVIKPKSILVSADISAISVQFKRNVYYAIRSIPEFLILPDAVKLAVISHVVARGEDFYNFIINDPINVLYLINGEYQLCPHYKLNDYV